MADLTPIQKRAADEVLATVMQENDAEVKTIKGYLLALAHKAWKEGEGFSGKRPFGNSGWCYEIYHALANAAGRPFPQQQHQTLYKAEKMLPR